MIAEELDAHAGSMNGSTGSRLLAGNLKYTENLEAEIAEYHRSEAGLIYNSGYDANVGLFSSLPQKGDTIITDELIHASIIDGARLSFANRYTFKHNDIASLEEKLRNAAGNCYVAIESVYSMDGDSPPIPDILLLTEKYNASLIVDEAHAVGLYEKGLVCKLGLESRVFARVVTFGKALGCHGAIVLGSKSLRNYLINFSRSFIYTTAMPFHQLAAIRMAYKLLPSAADEAKKLHDNISLFRQQIIPSSRFNLLPADSMIQSIVVGSNEKAKAISGSSQEKGLDVRPILSPTVPQGTERLRISLHSFNTDRDIILLANTINELNYE